MDDHDIDDHETMEEAEGGGGSTGSSQGGSTRTRTRSYECTFCKRGFSNAQALGGHMNIHRKDKARLKHNNINNYSTTTSSSSNEAVGYPNLAMINPTNTWSWVVNDTTTHHHDYYPNYNYIVPAAAAQQQLLPTNLFVPQPAPLANYDYHQFAPERGRSRRSSGSSSELDLELRLGTMDPHHHHHHRQQPTDPPQSSTILGTRKFF